MKGRGEQGGSVLGQKGVGRGRSVLVCIISPSLARSTDTDSLGLVSVI